MNTYKGIIYFQSAMTKRWIVYGQAFTCDGYKTVEEAIKAIDKYKASGHD